MTDQPKKRGRPAAPKPSANWKVGMFEASFEDDHYILRSGPSLVMRTKSEAEFNSMCALIEMRGKK